MLLDICLGTRSAWKILFVLCEAPGKAISRKEIQKFTRLGNKVMSKFLVLLEKFEIIRSHKEGNRHFYKLNLSSPFATQIIDIVKVEKNELNNPDFAVLNILRDFVYELINLNLANLDKVILFGSYAKRTFMQNSDIDVAVIFSEKDPKDELVVIEIIDNLKNRYKKEIQPHYFTAKEFEEQKGKLLIEIKRDGIVLV